MSTESNNSFAENEFIIHFRKGKNQHYTLTLWVTFIQNRFDFVRIIIFGDKTPFI